MNEYLKKVYEEHQAEINNPDWDKDSPAWEWKAPEALEKRWPELSDEIKTVIYLVAQFAVESEPWQE